jgi:hypothetical protein
MNIALQAKSFDERVLELVPEEFCYEVVLLFDPLLFVRLCWFEFDTPSSQQSTADAVNPSVVPAMGQHVETSAWVGTLRRSNVFSVDPKFGGVD